MLINKETPGYRGYIYFAAFIAENIGYGKFWCWHKYINFRINKKGRMPLMSYFCSKCGKMAYND